MKIIRHLTPAGPVYASLQPDGTARQIIGDIYGDYAVTERVVTPGKLLAPVVPINLPCIGLNYKKHAAESNSPIPPYPVLFIKNTASVQNPGDPIEIPVKLASAKVDYECELAVVIGKRCKNVTRYQALDYVLGYTCANDVSARDWQRDGGGGQWCTGKGFDTFAPLGPVLVTQDELPKGATNLRIQSRLNGQIMQDANTRDMIWGVAETIVLLSECVTLEPGDLIIMGTPAGVGHARTPQVWMKAGDSIDIEIEQIGILHNSIENEAA